jgi:FkbM family methyltransferase
MWLALSLTANALLLVLLLAAQVIRRRRRYKKKGKGCLSNWLFGRKFDPYNWHDNGEKWLLNRLAAFRPSTIFDVGANVGDWSALAHQAIPNAQIHSFEIIDGTYAALRKRLSNHRGVHLNNFGLSDKSGTITMRLFDSSNGLASHVAFPHGSYSEAVCPVRRGDEYMRDNGIERIDFLKIDVEGAEHLVLNGFGTAIGSGQIDVIQFEYGKVNILTHFLLGDFYDFLEARGYSVGKLFPDHVDFRAYRFDDEDFSGPNYVAVRKECSDIIDALCKR